MRAVPRIGSVRMSLWRRAPREVYRVYGEDQYLEGEMAAGDETAAREDSMAAEPDSRGVASWAAPVSPGTAGSSSARPSGSHAGRLVGLGLLVGVGLATLALVFLNMSHRHGAAPGPVGQGARIETGQRVAPAARAGRASATARSKSRLVSTPRFSASSAMAPERQPRSRLDDDSDPAPRAQRVSSLAPRPSGNAASASVAIRSHASVALESPVPDTGEPHALGGVEPSTRVSAEPYVQDEFGFER